ncbi:MAG: hypothetical protein VB913_06905 [Rhodospirillales bacterium]
MPVELRRLVFSEEEVQAALINYALRSDMRLPSASVRNVKIYKKDGLFASLVYPPNEEGEAREVEFSEAHLAAAIILYCRVQEIPVPRDVRKVLTQDGNKVAMTMQVHYGDQPKKKAEAASEAVENAQAESAASEASSRLDKD